MKTLPALVALVSWTWIAPASGQLSVIDSERMRLELGRKLAAGKEMRDWQFTEFKEPMQDWPREVRGAFVELRCVDLKHSEAALIVVRDDFRLRAYPAKSLTAKDRALAEKLEAERVAKLPVTRKKTYQANLTPYTKADADITESEHFTFYMGRDPAGTGKEAFSEPDFLKRQIDWFEKVWTHLDRIGAPLPMADEASPKKINTYVTGTGLSKHPEGFAFGGEAMVVHPAALGPGSSVVIHEFTHAVQFYSKGYRDSPYVGWFWECHANWSTHQFMPGYPPVLAFYADRAHYELTSTRHNYGSWPFLQTLAENPKFGPAFPYDIWPLSKHDDNGMATEDPIQTIMRVGKDRGVWKDGIAGFGDVIGELAARMVAWDFQNQYHMRKDMRDYQRNGPGNRSNRTVLEPVADRAGWWKPIYSHAPRQYGVNLVELAPDGKQVEAVFAGIVDEQEGSDWRVTLVAYDELGQARYSPTIHQGKVTLDVNKGEKVALAIAAAPTKYEPLGFHMGFNKKRRYPYEVTFRGAVPVSSPPAVAAVQDPEGRRHPNGGGFVASSAKVDSTAYVGPDARVLDAATVTGEARIEDHAVVRQSARVGERAIVGGFAIVGERAEVSGDARVRGSALLSGQAKLGGNARLLEYASIDGNGTVSGNVLVKGFGEVRTAATTELTGSAICGEDLEVHLAGHDQPKIDDGMLYGFLDSAFLKKVVKKNNGLYAHWDFNQPRQQVLKDVNADCDGILRGNPKFGTGGDAGTLAFDGKSRVLVEGHLIDTRDVTFDLTLAMDGGTAGQRIFEFGDAKASVMLGIGQGGKPRFGIHRNGESSLVESTVPLKTGKFTRLTVTLQDGAARIYTDGKLSAEQKDFKLRPEDVRACAGWIGSGVAEKGFTGRMDDFAIYRKGIGSVEELPADPAGEETR